MADRKAVDPKEVPGARVVIRTVKEGPRLSHLEQSTQEEKEEEVDHPVGLLLEVRPGEETARGINRR